MVVFQDHIPFADPSKRGVAQAPVQAVRCRSEGIVIDDIEVRFGVVVVVEKDAAPRHARIVYASRLANGGVGPIAVIEKQLAGVEVGDVEVHPAVVVDVRCVDPHAIALVVQPHARGVLREAALAVVAKKLVDLVAIVGDIEVHIAVVVRIKKQRPHANARIHRSRGKGDVLKAGTFEVAQHGIVAVDVHHIEVQPAVSVDISSVEAAARPGVACIPGVCCIGKGAVAVVKVQAVGIQVISCNQVQPAVVIEVRPKHRVGRTVIRHSSGNRHLLEFHSAEVSE